MSTPSSPPRLSLTDHPQLPSPKSQPPSTAITTFTSRTPSDTGRTSVLGPPLYESARLTATHVPSPFLPAQDVQSASRRQQDPTTLTGIQTALAPPTLGRSVIGKLGRKSKAHVASACVNCKKAHLSCDVNRPCTRCVASGKQDTCFDVQHKKRGRPRLRDEGDFKIEQILPVQSSSSTPSTGGLEASERPVATPSRRRAESYRSLRSQGSDSSGVTASPTYPYPPPPTATFPAFSFQQPQAPTSILSTYEVPTAYLDLDLVILRANQLYCQIMLGGREVAGLALSEITTPVEGESFQSIRNRLRTERETRDPAYMAPIHQSGQAPLQEVSEADVETYTHGFDDNNYTWTQTQAGPAAETFPARVRLAKSGGLYFVAVTLPSFRPVERSPAQTSSSLYGPKDRGLQSQRPRAYSRSAARQLLTQPSGYNPFPGASSDSFSNPPRTYPPPQPPPPRLAFPAPPPPTKLSIAEPPTETTAFTPRASAREQQPTVPQAPQAAGPQLAPMVGGQAAAGSSSHHTGHTPTPAATVPQPGEESEGEETPRKRLRMGIKDVVHP